MGRNNRANILAVDDEADILKLLEFNLSRDGYNVIVAKDGPEALDLAEAGRPDLIILDIMLPNMEGTEVLKRLKAAESTRLIPVIMLTAKGEEIDRIIGFELGAEDYITKPFSPRELLLRVRAVLKRATTPPADHAAKYSFKELTIDPKRHRVTVKGALVELTTTEFKLLEALLDSRGRVLTRDFLLDRVWGIDKYVISRTVDTHIRRLRSKLEKAGRYIETVRGLGYRFVEESPDG